MIETPHTTRDFMLPSSAGVLEAELMLPVPEREKYPAAAIICHPHPLYGGSMHGKVVVAMSHAFLSLGLPALRFNFRGVGKSSGKYDNGRGEQDDAMASLEYMKDWGDGLIIAGHSFGAWMSMKAGCEDPRVTMVIGAGTPVNLVNMTFVRDCMKPRYFIHGTRDQLIPMEKVEELYSSLSEPKKLIKMDGADHFFTGKLDELSEIVKSLTKEYLHLQ
jgi:alpha/beta superfamily hydrolase